jgi:hypothetical protein
MISSTSLAPPANPAQTSILGIPSPSDSTSSFADQLANEVSQAGSAATTTAGTPRQNSDTQQASGSTPVQYSFFQYLIGTPSTSNTPPGSGSPQASDTSSAATVQRASAPDSSNADPGWLSPPYYTPPPTTFVSWEGPPGVINTTASPESDLQNMAAQFINDPLQFDWGGVPATTPQEFIDNVVSYAQSRAASFPKASPVGYDPVAMGTKYANLVLDSIKKIPYDTVGSSHYASVYDAWAAGVNTWTGANGTPSAG